MAGLLASLASTAPAQGAELYLELDKALIARGERVTGTAIIYADASGPFDLTAELLDSYGRVIDRSETQMTIRPGYTFVPISLDSDYAATMYGHVTISGQFSGGGEAASPDTLYFYITPDPLDLEDFWCTVWGDGNSTSPDYFNGLRQGAMNLGHIYGNSGYSGAPYNLHPLHDFLEDKQWFEMAHNGTAHTDRFNAYQSYLSSVTPYAYGTPEARQHLVRPASLHHPASLQSMANTVRSKMGVSAKWRPHHWNIADEYGWGDRAKPFDYDLGPDCIGQFVAWLQDRYGDIATLNGVWNTSFASFEDLRDPIHAPARGQAALIVTQEIRDREMPVNSGTGLQSARNFAPWGDFRTFMDISFAAAMKRAVEAGRAVDSRIPVGFEGAEPATPTTGYDYWRQLREVDAIEPYDLGNSPEYVRSMRHNRYGRKVLSFMTLFTGVSMQKSIYQLWYRLLHYGATATLVWSNVGYFVGPDYMLHPFATGLAPTFREFQDGLAKLLNQTEWDDSQVALLYSQKSIQVNWMVDSEPDLKYWLNRTGNYESKHNSMFYTQVGWCKALEDVGVKGRFISYEEVVDGELTQRGVKVLILPRVMAMSAEERAAIEAWVNAGGVVIADHMCGTYDAYLRRRSITDGGGWWDYFLGVRRTSYSTTEYNGTSGSAYGTQVPTFQTPPSGFEVVTQGVTADGLYAVESGLRSRAGMSTPLALFNNDPNKPVLIVKNQGAGKIVYMNLSLYRYGFSSDSFLDERLTPGGPKAANLRRLVRNLLALGGVTPKVVVKQGHDNPGGTEVYNLEKSLRVDGQNRYVTCVVNSYMDGSPADDWSNRNDTPAVLFGQPGVANANVTLVLSDPAHVYDVRQGQYLGYGTSVNATIPVYQGAVFALLPYPVAALQVPANMTFDAAGRPTVTCSVIPGAGTAGNHVLRLEVFDPANQPLAPLNAKVVATGGTWTGQIPFALSETVVGSTLRLTDVATGVSVDRVIRPQDVLPGDADGDGDVDVSDIIAVVTAFGTVPGAPLWNVSCEFDGNGIVDLGDLITVINNFGTGT